MPSLIKDKSGIFYIVFFQNGKRIWRSTRTRNKEEAYQKFLNRTSPDDQREDGTLSKCIEDYLSFIKINYAKKTYGMYRIILQHFHSFLKDTNVDLITSRHIDVYKIERSKKVKSTTVNIEIRGIRAFFNRLKRWEIITKNPCDGISQIRTESIPVFIKKEELPILIDGIKDNWLRDIVVFAIMTGMRLGELLNLNWSDVNFGANTILVRDSDVYRVKGGKSRIVPLNSTAIEILSHKRKDEGLIFKGKLGNRANPNFVSKKFRLVIRSLGLDRKLHFHSLRHTFASLLVMNGTSLYQVQKLLGHSSSRVTEIYAHLQNSELHHVVNDIAI